MVLSLLRSGHASRPVLDPALDAAPDPALDPALDPGSAPGADMFGPGGDLTVGVEEELLLVDDAHRLVDEDCAQVWIERTQERAPRTAGVVSGELFGSEIEFATAVCADAGSAAQQLSVLRAALVSTGARPMAVGLHPDAAFGEPRITHAPRYEYIGQDLAGILRTPTAAFQVHVGLPDATAAVTAYRALRQQLPLLRALAAGTPYWHGRDSGLATARAAVIASYPRSALPPVVRSWDEYVALTRAVLAAAEAPDQSFVWWGARIQARLGTVEVRVMDPQPSLAAGAGLAALVQGIAAHALDHPPVTDVPGEVLAENDFRALRHGLETTLVDPTGAKRPVREIAAGLVDEARSALRPLGADAPLTEVERILASEPAYVRHRRLHATGGMPVLLADLVERTTRGW
jgi:carboxylate-amine ligase